MSWLYDLGFLIFGIISLPHFVARLGQAEDRGRLLRERFGILPKKLILGTEGTRTIWVHGVSVGEVLAVEPFIRLLLERRPDVRIVLTTVTPTGQSLAKKWENERLQVLYFPLDFRFAVRRFFKALKPELLLLMETEIWPNVIKEAKNCKVPVGVINGRISESSFKGFRRFSGIFKPVLENIAFFLLQTELDRERLMGLGVDPGKIQVTGNMKLDAFDFNGDGEKEESSLHEEWGFSRSDQILIGGSTHEGEERILLRALKRLRGERPSLKLFLAPRHIERAPKVLEQVKKEGFRAGLTSSRGEGFDVLILDRLGELRRLYAMADAVVMGGSFIRHGGQSPIEPACRKRAILHGPWVANFHEIYRKLDEEGGSLRVKGEEELVFALKRILGSDRERQYLGDRAYEVLSKLRGATERNLTWIERSLT
jgi:3-deoxy-D-manno-octulosonic-acid transferase